MSRPVRLPLVQGGYAYVVPSPAVCVFGVDAEPHRSAITVGALVSNDNVIDIALPAADVVALLWHDEPAAPEVDPRVWRLIEALADECDETCPVAWDAIDKALDLPESSLWAETAAALRSLLPVRR